MRTCFAKAFELRNDFKPESPETQDLAHAAHAVRLIIIKKESAALLNKEEICCLLATD